MNGKIDAFVATASTGGTLSGVAKRLKENDPGIKIVLADPEGSVYKPYFEGKEVSPALYYGEPGIRATA